MILRIALFILVLFCVTACKEEVLPKPKAYLRLDYPEPEYKELQTDLPFSFQVNALADSIGPSRPSIDGKTRGIDIVYPSLKGTIYLTYQSVDNNLEALLTDAQNITQKHTIKADEIVEQPFQSAKNNVFGMFYEVGGDAASQSQFYVTDSTRHFITGSLYFYAKPNYDSILPAAYYLQNDIRHIMETIKWNKK
ncbi:MAG: gliding motility lipoprotein GldD [Bacteroidia bacterium]|nr:gliding motility lipoprotein GldD [Bacteroidia bacterium]MBT8270040.1 gliding motility lipoprotein GldD [Bacteroidia bacterium]NNF83034.1 gliding motility lipoprotein GldD [Flavobacteriaceae bacterium]NNK70787.1 gliding motility lipoprotein GldD [Flavobacteriaceae bacterium]NNL79354.1 gliding motility lipoprotein GldD [Flavobacteriaceae bacterium]